jgi:hypothetical protein
MGTAPDADPLAGTTEILVQTPRALGEAGQPDAASRFAAKAWWLLRDGRPREAERINGAMHYLARLLEESPATPIAQEAT